MTTTSAPTILLVDDSPVIRSVVRIYLGKGFELVEAEGGERALQILKLVPVNAVIADINMKGMDGIALVKKIRASEEERIQKVPIILLTGERAIDLQERGFQAGADAFLKKPVSSAGLLDALAQLGLAKAP